MSRLQNLTYTVCRECGTASNMIPCPVCTEREIEAAKQKRVVMVRHIDGVTVADPAWLAEQRISTAAAAVAAIEREAERQAWPQNQAITTNEAAPLADAMVKARHEYLANLTPDEMKRIAEDAMQNQPPIEY